MPSENPSRPELATVLDAPPFHVVGIDGGSGDLVVSFASIGHDPARAPSPEFVASASAGGRGALFVSDESRSWANAPGFAGVLETLRPRCAGRKVIAVGQSMGAFAALVAGTVLPVQAILAFGPQYSVSPIHPVRETRWQDWTLRIRTFAYPTAPLPEGPQITLFHGLLDDRAQAFAFPERAGVDHLLFPDLDHSGLVQALKTRGVLAGLIDASLSGDRRRLLRIASSAGGIQRRKGLA
jgi:pimeloyl-ACP methyl ester carboxylesterase